MKTENTYLTMYKNTYYSMYRGNEMLIETEQMMPITRLQKELTQTVRKVAENNESIYILKNNNMEAVMIPFHQYEYLSMLEDVFERMEISETIKARMKNYDSSKNVSWEAVREEQPMEEKLYNVELIPEAQKDYQRLDGSVKKQVNKEIDKLQRNPLAGDELGNKDNVDLTGFYKLYACNKSIRIVYRLITPEKIEIVEIWGIGRRDKMEIYKIVGKRLQKKQLFI